MGSNKLVATYTKPAAAAAAAAAVCCMCGDHGLLPELFRCTACSVRSQHTYCTDQYPKAESYGTCNWCLRADGVSPAKSSVKEPVLNHHHRRPILTHSNQLIGGGGNAVSAGPALKTARGDFVSHQSKPIKKQRLLRRSASDLGTRVRADEAPPSPGIGRGRPRVRRYKLLEEVITS